MRRVMLMAAIVALVAVACGSDDAESETTPAPTAAAPTTTTAVPETTTTQPPAAEVSVMVAETELGAVLVDSEGYALYLFTPDEQGDSVCYDECEANWPPLPADVAAGDGIDAGLLGSAPRNDGSEQATYNGWPLYYFVNDAAPGELNGQGVGDVWYVLDASGNGIGIDG